MAKKKGSKKSKSKAKQDALPFPGGLPEPDPVDTEPKTNPLRRPIWTENKAKFIERYLLYFVFVTHHGAYIDGFAGPQEPDNPEMWTAKLVLDSEPKWLRQFHLFDIKPEQVKRLEELKQSQPERDSKGRKVKREIKVYPAEDFNTAVHKMLNSGCIRQTEATFCLLDQRAFQCHWATVEALARYKEPGEEKIELFYFLAVGWLNRSIKNTTQDIEKLNKWWGRDDWQQFLDLKKPKQADLFVNRIKEEFKYKSVKAYPIFSRQNGGSIMYYMIHATDHLKAPYLMTRAYNRAVFSEQYEQLQMEFKECPSSFGVEDEDDSEGNGE